MQDVIDTLSPSNKDSTPSNNSPLVKVDMDIKPYIFPPSSPQNKRKTKRKLFYPSPSIITCQNVNELIECKEYRMYNIVLTDQQRIYINHIIARYKELMKILFTDTFKTDLSSLSLDKLFINYSNEPIDTMIIKEFYKLKLRFVKSF